jgi:histidinol-phosphate aminotransferase
MTAQPPPGATGMLRLNFNENTAGCSPAVLEALRAVPRAAVAVYPDYEAITRRSERWFGVGPGWVHLTNGLDESLQLAALWSLHAGAAGAGRPTPEILIVDPAFEVYDVCARAVAADVVRVAAGADFAFPLDRILAALTPRTRLVYLTDPNNPTGLAIPAGAVEAIAQTAPHALVLVDEAYADFSGHTSIGPTIERQRNIVVGRTFAKAHGLAGLRIGALVAHAETLDGLRRLCLPFNVNVFAVAALSAALDDGAYLDWYVAQSVELRALVYDFCRRRGFTFWPSEANFVLFRVGAGAARLVDAVRARGILIKDQSAAPGCAGCVRLSAGVVEHTRAALAAMEDALAPRSH